MRKLVTIRKIDAIDSIPDADAIDVATLDGWKVVVRKGEFKVGQYVFFFEIDSVLPLKEQFEFLRKGCYVKNDFVEGFRLKTVKLRKQVSQGLILPLIDFGYWIEFGDTLWWEDKPTILDTPEKILDADFAEEFGVVKWEPYMPPQLAGFAKGNFPSQIMKTDQERAQNLKGYIFRDWVDHKWEVTLKLDGSSMTAYNLEGNIGVCSRNLDLKTGDENKDNTFVKLLHDTGLGEFLATYGLDIAIQGEAMGEGIQGNREKIKGHELYVFNMQEILGRKFFAPEARDAVMKFMIGKGVNIKHVPILHFDVTLADLGITNFEELLSFAEGPSINHPIREGLVFKSLDDPNISFKIISTKFLMKEE